MKYHVIIHGHDEHTIVWEGEASYLEFRSGAYQEEMIMLQPEPEPQVEQIKTRKETFDEGVNYATVHYLKNAAFSGVEVNVPL